VSAARPDERLAALRIFFQHVFPAQLEARVANASALIARGELPPEGLLICRGGDVILGAITALPMAGAAALIWPPQVVNGVPPQAVEDALIRSAIAWLRQRGAKFAQALLAKTDVAHVQPLQRHGFQHITTLLHLDRELGNDYQGPIPAARLRCEPYTACDQRLFDKLLLASYEQTLDCPELNDLRTADDILAGYRAVPGSRLDRWWLVWHGTTPVGVLIMMPFQEPPAWEMAYVGLAPAARRQGFGRELTLQAMRQAWADGADRMTLTVDARNQPACGLYESLGFVEFDRREVYLAIFHQA